MIRASSTSAVALAIDSIASFLPSGELRALADVVVAIVVSPPTV